MTFYIFLNKENNIKKLEEEFKDMPEYNSIDKLEEYFYYLKEKNKNDNIDNLLNQYKIQTFKKIEILKENLKKT